MKTLIENKVSDRIIKLIEWTLAAIWLVITLYPLIIMLFNSMKLRNEYMVSSIWSLPQNPTFQNYKVVMQSGFLRSYANSIIVTSSSLLIMIILSSMAAYGLSKLKFPGKRYLYSVFLAGMMIPIHITIIPIFKITQSLHLYDTLAGLVGPYVACTLPMAIFILKGFMDSVPDELYEAGIIDGAGKMVIFRSLMLPVLMPAISTVMIYNAVFYWGEFLYALVLTMSRETRTINLGLWAFYGERSVDFTLILSAMAVCSVPMILLYALFQEKIISGMVAGAVKG